MAKIYLDNAAVTPPLPCALEAYREVPFGNPSSEHMMGQSARVALETARYTIAKCMDCESEEIYFTSTATEAAATTIRTLEKNKYKVVTSLVEHHAISENVEKHYHNNKFAFARMLANNETGELYSKPALYGDRLICDATAAVGHVPVSFKNFGADYLIADGIKFGSVPGAAFLIAKHNAPLAPLIRGGGQERGMRSGTENVPAICAMAAALEWQIEHMKENTAKLSSLFVVFQSEFSKIDGVLWNTPLERPHLPHILNVSFMGVDAHALALLLSREGVMVSAGAACSNGLNEPSHVIMAMFNDEARARSAIRISLSHENTMQECEQAAEKIAEAVKHLRSLN